jgi:hypothetical protein
MESKRNALGKGNQRHKIEYSHGSRGRAMPSQDVYSLKRLGDIVN